MENVGRELRGRRGRWLRYEPMRRHDRQATRRVLHDRRLRMRAARAERADGRAARLFSVVGARLQTNRRERHRAEQLHGEEDEERHGEATAAHWPRVVPHAPATTCTPLCLFRPGIEVETGTVNSHHEPYTASDVHCPPRRTDRAPSLRAAHARPASVALQHGTSRDDRGADRRQHLDQTPLTGMGEPQTIHDVTAAGSRIQMLSGRANTG